MPAGNVNLRANSDSRGVEGAVFDFGTRLTILSSSRVDSLDLADDLHEPLAVRRQVTPGHVRVVKSASDPVTGRHENVARRAVSRSIGNGLGGRSRLGLLVG